MASENIFEDAEVISVYTRAQALEDGVLRTLCLSDVAGFKHHVACTSGVWYECVAVPDGVDSQDEQGRMWDVLSILNFSIKALKGTKNIDTVYFQLKVRTSKGYEVKDLWAKCGPGDQGEPVITIMLVGED